MNLPQLKRNDLRVLRILWPKDASIATGRGFMEKLYFKGVLTINRAGRYVIAQDAREALIERGNNDAGKN